jgi:uncharacterized protein
MSQKAAKTQEPSMEEILASIRRIISDENGAAPEPAPAPAVSPPPPPPRPTPLVAKPAAPVNPPPSEPDILELTDMVEPKGEPSEFTPASPEVEFRDQARRHPEPEPLAHALPERAAYPTRLDEQLLSQRASEAVSAAFGTLANTMFAGGSRSIEDVVREMLRPMLKTWLEDNLPSLVERLVRAEIERVSRGGR